MAHPKSKRIALRSAYVFKALSLEEAARSVGVSPGTARRWRAEALRADGDDWDKFKAAACLAGEGMESVARQMLSEYVIRHRELMEAVAADGKIGPEEKVEALAQLADAFAKIVSSSKRVLPETDALATALEVIRKLTDFTRDRFPQHAAALLEVLEPFAANLAKELG